MSRYGNRPTSIDEMAELLSRLQHRVTTLERAPQLGRSAIDAGVLTVTDESGTVRQTIGKQADGTYTVVDVNGPIPPRPVAPTVVAGPGVLVVSYNGLFENAARPSDIARVEVHINGTFPFTPTDSTQVSEFSSSRGGTVTLSLPEAEVYVALQAVSTSGAESALSDAVAETPDPPSVVTGGAVDGDLLVGTVTGSYGRLPVGANDEVLTVVGGEPEWAPADASRVPDGVSEGDLLVGLGTGALDRLPVTADSDVLTLVGGTPAWVTPDVSPVPDDVTSDGDLLIGAAGVYDRLPVGTDDDVLTVVAGEPAWVAPVAPDPLTDADVAPVAPSTQTGSAYTFVLADQDRYVLADNAAAQTFTIPDNATVDYPLGARIDLIAMGAGVVTWDGPGLTIHAPHGADIAVQYGHSWAIQVAIDTWVLAGDLTP